MAFSLDTVQKPQDISLVATSDLKIDGKKVYNGYVTIAIDIKLGDKSCTVRSYIKREELPPGITDNQILKVDWVQKKMLDSVKKMVNIALGYNLGRAKSHDRGVIDHIALIDDDTISRHYGTTDQKKKEITPGEKLDRYFREKDVSDKDIKIKMDALRILAGRDDHFAFESKEGKERAADAMTPAADDSAKILQEQAAKAAEESAKKASELLQETVRKAEEKVKQAEQQVKEAEANAKRIREKAQEEFNLQMKQAAAGAQTLVEQAKARAEAEAKTIVQQAQANAEQAGREAAKKIQEQNQIAADAAKKQIEELQAQAASAQQAAEQAKQALQNAKEMAAKHIEEAKKEANEIRKDAQGIKKEAQESAKDAEEKLQHAKNQVADLSKKAADAENQAEKAIRRFKEAEARAQKIEQAAREQAQNHLNQAAEYTQRLQQTALDPIAKSQKEAEAKIHDAQQQILVDAQELANRLGRAEANSSKPTENRALSDLDAQDAALSSESDVGSGFETAPDDEPQQPTLISSTPSLPVQAISPIEQLKSLSQNLYDLVLDASKHSKKITDQEEESFRDLHEKFHDQLRVIENRIAPDDPVREQISSLKEGFNDPSLRSFLGANTPKPKEGIPPEADIEIYEGAEPKDIFNQRDDLELRFGKTEAELKRLFDKSLEEEETYYDVSTKGAKVENTPPLVQKAPEAEITQTQPESVAEVNRLPESSLGKEERYFTIPSEKAKVEVTSPLDQEPPEAEITQTVTEPPAEPNRIVNKPLKEEEQYFSIRSEKAKVEDTPPLAQKAPEVKVTPPLTDIQTQVEFFHKQYDQLYLLLTELATTPNFIQEARGEKFPLAMQTLGKLGDLKRDLFTTYQFISRNAGPVDESQRNTLYRMYNDLERFFQTDFPKIFGDGDQKAWENEIAEAHKVCQHWKNPQIAQKAPEVKVTQPVTEIQAQVEFFQNRYNQLYLLLTELATTPNFIREATGEKFEPAVQTLRKIGDIKRDLLTSYKFISRNGGSVDESQRNTLYGMYNDLERFFLTNFPKIFGDGDQEAWNNAITEARRVCQYWKENPQNQSF